MKDINKMTNNEMIKKYLNQENTFSGFDNIINTASMLSREIFLRDVDTEGADAICAVIRFWNSTDEQNNVPVEERQPIKIYVDSFGGELVAAYTLIDTIALSKTPIWTIAIGAAYSAGFFIFITGHKRFAYPLASFLFHEGSTGSAMANAHKFRNQADFYAKQLTQLKNHTLKYTKLTEEDYNKIQKDDYWLTAEEAIEKGVADVIMSKGEL